MTPVEAHPSRRWPSRSVVRLQFFGWYCPAEHNGRPTRCSSRRRSTSGSRRWASTCSPATTARSRSGTARSSASARTRPRMLIVRTTGWHYLRRTLPGRRGAVASSSARSSASRRCASRACTSRSVTLGLAVIFPDLTEQFVNGTGGTSLVSLTADEVACPLVLLVPRRIAASSTSRSAPRISGRTTSRSCSRLLLLACRLSSSRGAGSVGR